MRSLLREYIGEFLTELGEEPKKPSGRLGKKKPYPRSRPTTPEEDERFLNPKDLKVPELAPEEQEKWGWMHPRGQTIAKRWSDRMGKLKPLPDEAISQLGSGKDNAVASEFGLPVEEVQWARIQNTPEIIDMLGKVPSAELARVYELPLHMVSRAASVRGIKQPMSQSTIDRFGMGPNKSIEPAMDTGESSAEVPDEGGEYSVFDDDAEERKASDIEGVGFSWGQEEKKEDWDEEEELPDF